MPRHMILGGQWGDEGKGKWTDYVAYTNRPEYAVRAGGGPNAGHTVWVDEAQYKLRQNPCGFGVPGVKLRIGAGTVVNPDVWLAEVRHLGIADRVGIDGRATWLEPKYVQEEKDDPFYATLGTTGTGMGKAVAARAERKARLVSECPDLQPFIHDVPLEINAAENVVIEGAQGFMLCNTYGSYRYCSSMPTTASAIAHYAGLGPKAIDGEIIMVVKVIPTRVGEGPLPGEITFEEAERRGIEIEKGTVTQRPRRPSDLREQFDLLKKAASINSATMLALSKVDRQCPGNDGVRRFSDLTDDARALIREIERGVGLPALLIGTGQEREAVIDLREMRR